MLDVDVDVRRLALRVLPRLGQESLEQQPVVDRIDGRHFEAVRDGTARGGAAALTEDVPTARIPHGVVHHEEEAGVAQLLDDAQLLLDSILLLRGELVRPPLVHAVVGQPSQALVGILAVQVTEGGQGRPHPRQVEVTRLGDRATRRDARGAPLPLRGDLSRRRQHPRVVRQQQPFARRLVDRPPVAQRHEHVERPPPGGVDVARVGADDPSHVRTLRQRDQLLGDHGLAPAGRMQVDLDGERVAARRAIPIQPAARVVVPTMEHELREPPRRGAGEQEHPLRPFGDVGPVNVRRAAPGRPGARAAVGPPPLVHAPDARLRDERAEVPVSLRARHEQRERHARRPRLVPHHQLRADDRPDPRLATGVRERDDPAEVRRVREAERVVAERLRRGDQSAWRDGALAEGERALRPELDERTVSGSGTVMGHRRAGSGRHDGARGRTIQSHQPCRYHDSAAPSPCSQYSSTNCSSSVAHCQ